MAKVSKAYIAQDKSGLTYLYVNKPFKQQQQWMDDLYDGYIRLDANQIPDGICPKWEDEEPCQVEMVIINPAK